MLVKHRGRAPSANTRTAEAATHRAVSEAGKSISRQTPQRLHNTLNLAIMKRTFVENARMTLQLSENITTVGITINN